MFPGLWHRCGRFGIELARKNPSQCPIVMHHRSTSSSETIYRPTAFCHARHFQYENNRCPVALLIAKRIVVMTAHFLDVTGCAQSSNILFPPFHTCTCG